MVKTAINGEDPNWGRVIMAVGKAQVNLDLKKLMIKFGPNKIIEKGEISISFNENEIKKYMMDERIDIVVDLGIGSNSFTAYTMDLSKRYVEINSDYRS